MNNVDKKYIQLLQHVLDNGTKKGDRTGTGTLSVFGGDLRFDLSEGFPLLTTKKLHIPSIVHELLWFLKGDTNVHYLQENGVRIWNEWADEEGELGPVYGSQWRSWEAPGGRRIDQISQLINDIKNNPDSRRHIVSAWNVAEIENMKLPPCHLLFQFYVLNGKLSCKLTMRSTDTFLGLPFNIASYALLTHMIAQECGLDVGEFLWSGGDVHIYSNHVEQVKKQLKREPKTLPKVRLNPQIKSVFDFKYEDIEFIGYDPHPAIKGKVAV